MTDLGSPTQKRSRSRAVVLRSILIGGFGLGLSGLGAFFGDLARNAPAVAADAPLAHEAPGLQHDWRLKLGRHWQITSTPAEAPEATDAAEGNRGACGPGMIEVKGRMKMDPS